MGEVAIPVSLQALVAAIARTSDAEFDLPYTVKHICDAAQALTGATGVLLELLRPDDGRSEAAVSVGTLSGPPRRLPVVCGGKEAGFVALYGARMLGPATADRTQVIADLAALALARSLQKQHSIHGPELADSKYRLITGVGHNLRNTLGAATGYMQLVEMEGPLSASQQDYVTRSRRAVGAAVSLIGDLLELTRVDAGKLELDREPVNVNAIARDAARKYSDTAAAKPVSINVDASPTNPVLFTDSSYVQQIIDVLVYNALRYTPPGGHITVRVDTKEGRRAFDPATWVCVAVTDDGPGVAEAEQVFEEVHRVEKSRGNARFRLAICRRIARLLGGDLTLETVRDAGSNFTLWLPAPSPQ